MPSICQKYNYYFYSGYVFSIVHVKYFTNFIDIYLSQQTLRKLKQVNFIYSLPVLLASCVSLLKYNISFLPYGIFLGLSENHSNHQVASAFTARDLSLFSLITALHFQKQKQKQTHINIFSWDFSNSPLLTHVFLERKSMGVPCVCVLLSKI